VQWIVWGGLVITVLAIAVAFIRSERTKQNRSAASIDLPVITQGLPPLTLTNQLGQQVTAGSFSNRVSVVDIVFTRCAGPCPQMTRQMSELQRIVPADLPVRFVTITTDPEFDSPEILKRYGERFRADPGRWWFLTGEKHEIARLAREGLKLVAQETKPEERQNDADLFIHSTVFVLLDKQGRLRGAIESTEPDFNTRVLRAVRRLAREK
jgi:cytochrome oxidase Cu insertion factor (SCO1/SenC/PrrC family)